MPSATGNYPQLPYDDDGYWQNHLKMIGGIIGQSLAQVYKEPPWLGKSAGQLTFGEVGWAIDNFEAIQQNFNTSVEQWNDDRTWSNWVDPLANWADW